MSYQVLARKWRPRRFSEVVGQQHVVRSLTNALEHGRLHHAYLFSGTRGVGKTTIARILAKAFNCDALEGSDACGECAVCVAVDEGRYVDLIEVDAASRTKVEDTRDLLDNVQYAPTQGRFKVYLIDEVHMLSGHSFNALLKTLEEPPPHVKFLLATTDPQKIPVTVLSRCLQLHLKRMSIEQIGGQLRSILERERVEADESALRTLARAADGSMRDALSLLDQAIAYGGGRVEAASVNGMLGTVAREPVFELMAALADGDARAVMQRVRELAGQAPDFSQLLQTLLELLQRIAVVQQVPEMADADDQDDRVLELARLMSPEDVQLYYQIGLVGQRDLPLAPDERGGFEMIVLRMLAFRPAAAERPEPAAKPVQRPAEYHGPISEPAAPVVAAPEPPAPAVSEPAPDDGFAAVAAAAASPPPESKPSAGEPSWLEIIAATGVKGMARELAHQCDLERFDGTTCTLVLDPAMEHLRSARVEQRLTEALQAYYKRPVRLQIRLQKPARETPARHLERAREERQNAAEQAIEQDPNIQALAESFDATIVPGSIEPLD